MTSYGLMKNLIHIRKQALKFSVAHMTVFPDGTKEALHGHNYEVDVTIGLKDIRFKKMISFSVFKAAIKSICELWDEKVLLATENPYFEIESQTKRELEFALCKKRYRLPTEECVLLPIDNVVCETLADEFLRLLQAKIEKSAEAKHAVNLLSVRIDESPGQGATVSWTA